MCDRECIVNLGVGKNCEKGMESFLRYFLFFLFSKRYIVLGVKIVKEGFILGYIGVILVLKIYVFGYGFFDFSRWVVVFIDLLCCKKFEDVYYLVSVICYYGF